MDDVEKGGLSRGYMCDGVCVEGDRGQKGNGVVEDWKVGGSVGIFDRGLNLEASTGVGWPSL